jgi:two-component system response regulator PhoP
MGKFIQVIYVDDDKETGSLLARILELVGIKVSANCRTAEELIEMVNTPQYREAGIFIIDIQLPKMTGVELVAKLRAEGETRPIILLSGFSKDDRWDLKEMRVEFIQKPYDFHELQQTINNLVHEPVMA